MQLVITKVIKAPAPIHGQLTKIRHLSNNSLFNNIPNNFGAIQFNSLVVSDIGLPDELEILAWGFNQGIENIMALRHRTRPLWGVQFHPEVGRPSFLSCLRRLANI